MFFNLLKLFDQYPIAKYIYPLRRGDYGNLYKAFLPAPHAFRSSIHSLSYGSGNRAGPRFALKTYCWKRYVDRGTLCNTHRQSVHANSYSGTKNLRGRCSRVRAGVQPGSPMIADHDRLHSPALHKGSV